MKVNPLFVFDTNALVSAHLVEGSVSDRAYKHALQLGDPHLRSLNPFRDIPILSPADFLKAF